MKDAFLFRLKQVLLLVLLSVSLQACSEHVHIIEADRRVKDETNTYVVVKLDSSPTTIHKISGIYSYIVATKCSNLTKKNAFFPMEAQQLDSKMANLFGITKDFDRYLVGVIDTSVLQSYEDPCLYIEGGSYLGVKMRSNRFSWQFR